MRKPADTVALRILHERKKSKLSQAALADRMGIEPSAISHWESHRREPSVTNLLAIADAIGCSPAALLPGVFLDGDEVRMARALDAAMAECKAFREALERASRVTRADLDAEFTL